MTDRRREEQTRRFLSLAAGRLAANRWMLVAALAALAVVGIVASVPVQLAAAIAAFLIVVAAMSPRRTRRQARADRAVAADGGGLGGLSAQSLAAAVGDPLIIFDAAGTAVLVNEAARAAFGAIAPGLSLLMKFRAPEMQTAIDRVRTGAVASEVVDYAERVPIERVYKVTLTAIGRGTGLFVMVFKDQSEARRIDRMRADFIANASHELRTPLASISGFVETLRGPAKNDAAAREHFLQIMQSQTQRMARLIDDLLSLSRLEMKPYLPPGATVDVCLIVQSVIDSLSPLAAESGVVIERAFGDETVEARGDRDELFQVFENLLENACKYGQSGGRVVVSIDRTEAPEPEVAVTIRDFGPGIPQEHIPRVTERFYRVDVDTSRAQKGTGLGLSIVKHILTRHNARLSIKSTLGEGAAFTVHLPAK
ncbi:MAG: two-component sensor histidine kinase [Mesorhizobium sp.]|nr:ATP-binding protein [Mesorhizobium sp.]MBL8580006.1 two-component sensor histidine kinase [Mesorhizobium sp.]